MERYISTLGIFFYLEYISVGLQVIDYAIKQFQCPSSVCLQTIAIDGTDEGTL